MMSGEQSKLEIISIEARKKTISLNTYNSENNYSEKHTRAMSDEETPEYGKGTGKYLDTQNGGTRTDINGVSSKSNSGRNGNISMNGYNRDKPYTAPDTSKNTGQIKF